MVRMHTHVATGLEVDQSLLCHGLSEYLAMTIICAFFLFPFQSFDGLPGQVIYPCDVSVPLGVNICPRFVY